MINDVVEQNTTSEGESGLSCPKCGSNDVLPVSQTKGKTKGFGLGKAAVGGIAFGPIGLAAGAIGMGKGKTKSEIVWVCKNCGNQFNAKKAIASKKNKANNAELGAFVKKHPIITIIIVVAIIIFAIVSNKSPKKTEDISITESQNVSNESNSTTDISTSYKLVNEKLGKSGFVYHKIEIFVVNDRDYNKMFNFAKEQGRVNSNSDTMFRAVFFDNESYAVLPEGQIQSEYWDDDYLKHMVAKYTKNFVNNFEEFLYWEGNAYESPSKKLK
jgi:uncharacterized C2H2 Zn-finger protein